MADLLLFIAEQYVGPSPYETVDVDEAIDALRAFHEGLDGMAAKGNA